MKPRDLFTTAIRVIGVIQLIRAFDDALEAFDIASGYFKPVSTTIGACMTHTTFHFVLGVFLLVGAPGVTSRLFSAVGNGKPLHSDSETGGQSEV